MWGWARVASRAGYRESPATITHASGPPSPPRHLGLQLLEPVEHGADLRRMDRRFVPAEHEHALAVRGDLAEAPEPLEGRLRWARREPGAGRDGDGENRSLLVRPFHPGVTGRLIERAAVAGPGHVVRAVLRDPPAPRAGGIRAHVELIAPRVIGQVRQPAAVRRHARIPLVEAPLDQRALRGTV